MTQEAHGAAGNGETGAGSGRRIDRLWGALGKQLQHPTGAGGSIVGWLMAMLNEEPSRLAIDALDIAGGETILDLGFGPGRSLAAMAARYPGARLFGIDQSTRMLELAARRNRAAIASGRVTLVQGPFAPLPWGEGVFDRVLLLNVVYFVDRGGWDVRSVHRVLKPGGRVVVYATDQSTMKHWPFAGPETHRTFGADQLRDLLEDGRFARAQIKVEPVKLPYGINGLLAVARKRVGGDVFDPLDSGRVRERNPTLQDDLGSVGEVDARRPARVRDPPPAEIGLPSRTIKTASPLPVRSIELEQGASDAST